MHAASLGKLNVPPEIGDAHDYDAIGFQLSKGQGFSVDWNDREFKGPYLLHNMNGKYDFLMERHWQGGTAYRPPLLPGLIALSHLVFGREFWPIRLFNIALLSITCAIVFVLISQRFGILPESFELAKDPIDPYETDRAYWRSLWHQPAGGGATDRGIELSQD